MPWGLSSILDLSFCVEKTWLTTSRSAWAIPTCRDCPSYGLYCQVSPRHTRVLANQYQKPGRSSIKIRLGRKTEGREQKTEDRRQRTEDRGQKTEDRRQRTEGREQKTEDRGRRGFMRLRGRRAVGRAAGCCIALPWHTTWLLLCLTLRQHGFFASRLR